jgi:hypothetical protein
LWCVRVDIKTETTKTASNTPNIKVIKGERAEIALVELLEIDETKFVGSSNINYIYIEFLLGGFRPRKNYLFVKLIRKIILRIPKKAKTTENITAIIGNKLCIADEADDIIELTISLDKFIIKSYAKVGFILHLSVL